VNPCQKRNYRTKRDAKQAMRSAQAQGKGRLRLRAYRCPHCPYWHLTSQPKEKP
jgi:hypothetical protein